MMLSFVKTLLIVLTLRLIVVKSAPNDFCRDFGKIREDVRANPTLLEFIPTANGIYLYLDSYMPQWGIHTSVYKFDTICKYGDKCPKIGERISFTQFTANKLNLLSIEFPPKRYPFIHNGITYLYGDPVDNDKRKVGIKMYANGTTDWIYKSNEWLDKSIKSYAICYRWKTENLKEADIGDIPGTKIKRPKQVMTKHIESVFVPPFEPNLRIGSIPQYGFTFDKLVSNDITVEVTGNYPKVDIVFNEDPYLYTFGDYIVPCTHQQYVVLPNGDAIATVILGYILQKDGKTTQPDYGVLYFRSDPTDFDIIIRVDLWALFGCDGKAIPPRNLSDYETDNIYSYFNKN